MKYTKYLILAGIGILMLVGFDVFKYAESSSIDFESIYNKDTCTDIVVGKNASVDGAVITSHTGMPGSCRACPIP